jgi:hypothetical protein
MAARQRRARAHTHTHSKVRHTAARQRVCAQPHTDQQPDTGPLRCGPVSPMRLLYSVLNVRSWKTFGSMTHCDPIFALPPTSRISRGSRGRLGGL